MKPLSVCKCLEKTVEQIEKGKWWDILRRLCLEGRWRKMSHYNTEKWCSERYEKTRNERGESEGKGELIHKPRLYSECQ